jgi:hypothetical protein
MISAGLLAADIFSGKVEAVEIIAKGIVVVPAGSYNCTTYMERQSGIYFFQISTIEGRTEAYINGENSTVNYWENGSICSIPVSFNGSSGEFGCNLIDGVYSAPLTRYLVFNNPGLTDIMVNYEVSRHWTYNNYFGLTAGIALAAGGALVFALTLLGDKLRSFNKALENQK